MRSKSVNSVCKLPQFLGDFVSDPGPNKWKFLAPPLVLLTEKSMNGQQITVWQQAHSQRRVRTSLLDTLRSCVLMHGGSNIRSAQAHGHTPHLCVQFCSYLCIILFCLLHELILSIVYLCILCIRRSSFWLLYFNKRVCVLAAGPRWGCPPIRGLDGELFWTDTSVYAFLMHTRGKQASLGLSEPYRNENFLFSKRGQLSMVKRRWQRTRSDSAMWLSRD